MANHKKRPSKKAKAALKVVNDSELLAAARAHHTSRAEQDFRTPGPSPRTRAANKKRPNKKRG